MTPLTAGIIAISALLLVFLAAFGVYFMLVKQRQRDNEADFAWSDDMSDRTRRMLREDEPHQHDVDDDEGFSF